MLGFDMHRKHKLRFNDGFTIVEIIVVLLIVLLLLVVLAPTVQKIHQVGLCQPLNAVKLLDVACKRYYEDFAEFPPSRHEDYPGWHGKELLVLFLVGYGPDAGLDGTPGTDFSLDDGREGFGFRVERAGRIFGPYNGAEMVKTKLSSNGRPVFVDDFDEEIYYYRYDAVLPGYHLDNPGTDDVKGPIEWFGADYAQNKKDFILATRGPDGKFQDVDDDAATDDITNFLEEQ